MYTLKSIATRGTALGAAFALVAAAVVPAASVFADALNPLTERSLMLSSSAPGYTDTDGSGNSEGAPNAGGGNFAPPGSGPNGKKTGETFTFNVSSDSSGSNAAIKGISFQYCTSAAGKCQAPGDNGKMVAGYNGSTPQLAASTAGDARDGVYVPTTNELGRPTNAQAHPQKLSDLDVVGAFTEGTGPGQFQVFVENEEDELEATSGWTMNAVNLESQDHSGALTGKKNYITLVNSGAGAQPANGETVQVVFRASSSNYITNPGSGSFFVKINTYSSDTSLIGNHNDETLTDNTDSPDHTVIDGGVTVANMMTDSIHITTKVLETMDFSVGVRNKDTTNVQHGSCDPIEVVNNNRLDLGDVDAERSLRTDTAYDAHSYWRLSSNSSGGATVYYSGSTLNNTVGDKIDEMGAEKNSQIGTEQFGLALIDPTSGETFDDEEPFPSNWETPSMDNLVTDGQYDEGGIASISDVTSANNAKFAFFESSQTVPEVIAQNNTDVIRCATSKVRYVANIAADTPAGVYTTKINYLASPQY